ncbi:ribosomal L7Ae/L30e/S12e/Gadd45 family protein [Halothermothrix orenii]|uniref:Ribosomal protein L7Ae/L30e/S12e/Gadd45 n=1 Tax=Halothermothrix orenii (strain H 168 / OCM 544 / DSM 9562) TaxID=373903 RepID=B8D0B8_HALOH|nr:ribosomal L7Ae/L30e/S12e/Gadd45 family protein [Halothermothrix orenii]ACL68872.1 ribosomal protein L7Ae/L30e/S12e/Gadd45 [Halothermothrix orenii H 168]
MMLTELKNIDNKVVGTKQTLKAIKNSEVKKVFLAEDIDKPLYNQIVETATQYDVPIEKVDSKLRLGRACGIDVSAACAALLK